MKKEIKSKDELELVEGADAFHRGGLLRLGAVLTATSAPLRTSPVKRGDWVLRRILGTAVPPPPADAGSIPADDKLFGGLSRAARSWRRTSAMPPAPTATCASTRWASRWSTTIPPAAGARSMPTASRSRIPATLADKTRDRRRRRPAELSATASEDQVLRTLSHKLLGYALGRTVQASDQPLIDSMVAAGGDATFSQLAAEIVDQQAVPQSAGPRRRAGSRQTAAVETESQTRQVHDERPDQPTSRRHFLRGAGVALALPWMESLPLLAQERAAAAAANKPPLRFACIYFSNGVDPTHWWAKGSGAAMEFGPAAQPLTPIREDIVFVKGLYNQQAFVNPEPAPGPHGQHALRRARSAPIRATSASARPWTRCWRKQIGGADRRCRAWRWASSPTSCGWKTACR